MDETKREDALAGENEAVKAEADQAAGKEDQKGKKAKKKKTVGQEILSWVLTLLAAVAIAMTVRYFVFEPVRVDGHSMDTTLADKEVMLVTKPEVLLGKLKHGDVVVVRFPERFTETKIRLGAPIDISLSNHTLFVKRLVGLPGDVIAVQGGHLYLNDQPVDEPYVDADKFGGRDFARYTLKEDEYFVMGDNRANSNDSRSVGPLSYDMIVGHAKMVLLPLGSLRTIK
ncbi:MAG: signal peptidase I [Eubacteriales bacterium]